jgi:hypothetical protein
LEWFGFQKPCLLGKFYFQTKVPFTTAPHLEMFFWAKQNHHFTIKFEDYPPLTYLLTYLLIHTHRPPTTRYNMGRSSCLFLSLAHISLMERSSMFHISKCWEILLHQNQATAELCNSCGFSKMVLISHWLGIKSSVKHSHEGELVVVLQHPPLPLPWPLCSPNLTTPDNSVFQCIIIKLVLNYELLLMMPSHLLTL